MEEVTIHNTHPTSKIKKREIEKLVKRVLKEERITLPVDVIFTDDGFMKRINRKFTNRRNTTDVLSFGMKEGKNMGIDYPSLGDVYVSLDQAKRQAKERRIGLKEEVSRLVIHGLLHLFGYDHKNRKQAKIMEEKQEAYLNLGV